MAAEVWERIEEKALEVAALPRALAGSEKADHDRDSICDGEGPGQERAEPRTSREEAALEEMKATCPTGRARPAGAAGLVGAPARSGPLRRRETDGHPTTLRRRR